MAGVFIILILFYLAFIVFMVAAQWKIYTKAGKPGWACIIPFYSTIVLLEIVKKPTWWFVMFLIPFVNLYFAIVTINELAKAFGKSSGFTVGLILLPFVFFPILGFGDAQYLLNKTDEVNEIGTSQE